MGCTASQDAMDEKNKTSNGHYSDEGVFGAEEDFPLSIDEVREGTVWGGLRLKNKRQRVGQRHRIEPRAEMDTGAETKTDIGREMDRNE